MWTVLAFVIFWDCCIYYVGANYRDKVIRNSWLTLGGVAKGNVVFRTMAVSASVVEPGMIMTVFTIFMSKPRDQRMLTGQNAAYFVIPLHMFAIAGMCTHFGFDNMGKLVNVDWHIIAGTCTILAFPLAREVRRYVGRAKPAEQIIQSASENEERICFGERSEAMSIMFCRSAPRFRRSLAQRAVITRFCS